jgi:hypothetical protein
MDNKFYTYAWLREDGTPYYIGKGSGDRAWKRSRKGRSVKMPPKERILILKQNLTEEEAYKHEIYMIALYGRKDIGTGILRNLTDGGEGPTNMSPEKRSAAGRKRSHRMPREKRLQLLTENNRKKSHTVKVVLNDGEEKNYPSLRAAARELGCDKKALTRVFIGEQKKCKKFRSVRITLPQTP